MSEHSCGNCKFSEFQRTSKGRVKRLTSGRCLYVVPPGPPLPISITRAYDYRAEHRRRWVGAEEKGCPVFEAKETALPTEAK